MAKKKAPVKKARTTRQAPRHPIDPIIRAKLAELRATPDTTREQWERDQGFITALEWVLVKLEATRTT